jgi:hypothetical protein
MLAKLPIVCTAVPKVITLVLVVSDAYIQYREGAGIQLVYTDVRQERFKGK